MDYIGTQRRRLMRIKATFVLVISIGFFFSSGPGYAKTDQAEELKHAQEALQAGD